MRRANRTSSKKQSPGHAASSEPGGLSRKHHVTVAAVAALLVALAYANALRGEFVYDDDLEIVENAYIQRGELFWTAMTSDVWAFKGQRDEPWSNYWRPAFVAWMATNYQLFGLNVFGWHVTSLLAHLTVTLLVFRVLVRLEVRPWIAAVVTWMFAAHPVHVESVAWASGIPDIIMSAALLGSHLFYLAARRGGGRFKWIGAALLYGLALLCKEGAIVYPFLLFGTEWVLSRREGFPWRAVAIRGLRRAGGFLAIALGFVALRYHVLGMMRQLAPGAPDIVGVVATAPSILLFYLRQIVWPFSLGPVYGLRAVSQDNMGFSNFVVPMLVLIALAVAVWRFCRRRPALALGVLWFLFPIALSLDIRVFLPEQIVHDRYLYLALLGALLLITELVAEALQRVSPTSPERVRRGMVAAGLLVAVAGAVLTARYIPVWGDDVALWERGIAVDPTSATSHAELGAAYWQKGRGPDAKQAYTRAMELNPALTNAHLGLGIIAIAERRFSDAERFLKTVLDRFPDQPTARDQLALAYQQQGRLNEAIALFDEGRKRMPYLRGVYTRNIAVLLAMDKRTAEALTELESIRDAAETEPKLLGVWCQLGDLYQLHAQKDQAVNAYQRYLALSEGSHDAEIQKKRATVSQILKGLVTSPDSPDRRQNQNP